MTRDHGGRLVSCIKTSRTFTPRGSVLARPIIVDIILCDAIGGLLDDREGWHRQNEPSHSVAHSNAEGTTVGAGVKVGNDVGRARSHVEMGIWEVGTSLSHKRVCSSWTKRPNELSLQGLLHHFSQNFPRQDGIMELPEAGDHG